MEGLSDITQEELTRLLPSSILEDVACFVFYDNHPRDMRQIDITVCTKIGELKEYSHRDLRGSIHLLFATAPTEVIIRRNTQSELFYVVSSKDELQIVSYDKKLLFHTKFSNVDTFTVDDSDCYGQTYLKIIRNDDAVPIYIDEDFKIRDVVYPVTSGPSSTPIISELKRKYIEAQYSVKNNEKSMKEYIQLRHAATLSAYQNVQPNLGDSLLYGESNLYGALKVKTRKPWVKVCNNKVIVALHVRNEYNEDISEIHLTLISTNIISHTTKIFANTDTLPFWNETIPALQPNCEVTLVAVINLNEIQLNVTDKVGLKGALSYKTSDKTYLLPFEDVIISSLETFGDAFDALSSSEYDANTMLAILSTTEKTQLCARLITSNRQTFIDLLTKHLQMDRAGPDVVVYKKSPYHALNGAMLHFTGGDDKSVNLTAYTRTKSQLLALIHTINLTVPTQAIITTPNYIINTKEPELIQFCESVPEPPTTDHIGYAKTILNRITKILEYLDWSMVKMSESKDQYVRSKVGFQIDLYGCGKSEYFKFREEILKEERNGIKCLLKEIGAESMSVD